MTNGQRQEPRAGSDDFGHRHGAALVLGASGGIGSAVATMLGERGSRLAVTYRSRPGRVTALTDRDTGARAYHLDLADHEACARVVDQAASDFGGLHTVVYAAGPHVSMVHLSRVDPEQFAAQLLGDAAAFFNAVHPALPHLRQARGSVVAVTTAATARSAVRDGLSAAPKGAVEALVRTLAAEEGRFGVRANSVGPGMLTDGMAERLIASGDLDERALDVARGVIPLRTFGTANDVAEAVCFLASDRASYISGQALRVDGGYTA